MPTPRASALPNGASVAVWSVARTLSFIGFGR
jgi:hypothetical protein